MLLVGTANNQASHDGEGQRSSVRAGNQTDGSPALQLVREMKGRADRIRNLIGVWKFSFLFGVAHPWWDYDANI